MKCVGNETQCGDSAGWLSVMAQRELRPPGLYIVAQSFEKRRESEAPAELATLWFGFRVTPKFGGSLTLPSNELVGQNNGDMFTAMEFSL